MKSVEAFLTQSGMAPEFARPEEFMEKFLRQMERGLDENGGIMLPSYAPAAGRPPLGRPVAVLDVGGTYLRRALVTFTNLGPRVEALDALPTPGREEPVDWAGFLEALADGAQPLLGKTERLCLCFSHPAQMTGEMDGRVFSLSKEVAVSGARGRYVCAGLRETLEKRGIHLAGVGLVNDTVAALLGGAAALGSDGGADALVFATGLNLCLELPQGRIGRLGRPGVSTLMPVNTEAGHLDVFPGGEADRLLDEKSAAPGEGFLEKKVSGRYFGQLVRLTLHLAAEQKVFSPEGAGAVLGLEGLSTVEALGFLSAGEGVLAGILKEDDAQSAREIISALCRRTGALLCGLLSASMLLTGRGRDPSKPARTIVQGAMLERNPVLRESLALEMTRYAGGVLGLHHEFTEARDVNFLGAAAALLRRDINQA